MAEKTITLEERIYGQVQDRGRTLNYRSVDDVVNHDLKTFYLFREEALKSARAQLSVDEVEFLRDGAARSEILIELYTAKHLADQVNDSIMTYNLGTRHPTVNGSALVQKIASFSDLQAFAICEWLRGKIRQS